MNLSSADKSRIIEMAWEDRTPFEAIEFQFGLNERQLVAFMRRSLQPHSFKLWRRRVNGRTTKHTRLRSVNVSRAYCPSQYKQR
ncbi:MAG: TIGR03643 family protein [Gammaproteobacteria bacterium]|nr:TIGR03643 family protein [Gammaproteobacteria bacterium]